MLAKVRKLKDENAYWIEKEITDLFLATVGCEAKKKISRGTCPREVEELTYEEIARLIKKNVRPKKKD